MWRRIPSSRSSMLVALLALLTVLNPTATLASRNGATVDSLRRPSSAIGGGDRGDAKLTEQPQPLFEAHMREKWAAVKHDAPQPSSLEEIAQEFLQEGSSSSISSSGGSAIPRRSGALRALSPRLSSAERARRLLTTDVVPIQAPPLGSPPMTGDLNQPWYRFETVSQLRFVDWRASRYRTGLLLQDGCESCWALAATDLLSMLWALAFNATAPVPLAPQQVCDCGTGKCCSGGWPEWVFLYAMSNGGVAREVDYPYTAMDGLTCQGLQAGAVKMGNVSGWEKVPAKSAVSLMKAVSQQPVLVYIATDSDDFRGYTGGLFKGACGKDIDHAMIVMGYSLDATEGPYWLLKNTWGPDWGEIGYMKLPIFNDSQPSGKCNIHSEPAVYPTFYDSRSSANPCNVRPQPCGAGTCKLGSDGAARCTCPAGFVERRESTGPPKCVPADPCGANPNPCGWGNCSNKFDGSYTCSCPTGSVIGARTDGAMTCVLGTFQSGLQTYTVAAGDTCQSLARAFNITPAALEARNPFVDCSLPSLTPGYILIVAGDTNVTLGCAAVDLISPNDTCTAIASRNNVTTKVLQALNPGVNCSLPAPSPSLRVSSTVCVRSGMLSTTAPAAVSCGQTYRVQPGDTCMNVALNVSITLTRLLLLNPGLRCASTTPLDPSMLLCVAPLTVELVSVECAEWYSVTQADTCSRIANAALLSMDDFMKLNPGLRCDPPYFQIGQQVCVAGAIDAFSADSLSSDVIPYTVVANDTLASITKYFNTLCLNNTFPTSICDTNTLPTCDDSAISQGQLLLIPCKNRIFSDVCPLATSTVCGADGVTYGSGCAAKKAYAMPFRQGHPLKQSMACRELLGAILVLSLAVAAAAGPTPAEFIAELEQLQKTLAKNPFKYSIVANALRRSIKQLKKLPDANISVEFLSENTALIPTNIALTGVGIRAIVPKLMGDLIRFNVLEGMYPFAQIKSIPVGGKLKTQLNGKQLVRFKTQTGFLSHGTTVALGPPGANVLTWAQIDDPDLFKGKFIWAHGVDGVLKPNGII
ncbi:unnamed protein product [Closterium sp. Yama58-4]|nr:unnamed protein product [Closterium sp. Yama58-4]